MSLDQLFRDHVTQIQRITDEAVAAASKRGEPLEGVLFHSGTSASYHADDHDIYFHTVPHFARWVPLPGPDHLLVARPGQRPRLLRTVPRDYWFDAPAPLPAHCEDVFDYEEVPSRGAAAAAVDDTEGLAYVGDSTEFAARIGIPSDRHEPSVLLSLLDWARAVKTPYEVECLRQSARVAARGHEAARGAFEGGGSEREIHAAYLAAARSTENEMPYGNIVALDEHAAVLHYQNKRDHAPGRLLLIDAGAAAHGYATDVTRTYLAPGANEGPMGSLLDGMDRLQRRLVEAVRPGHSYVAIHVEAHRRLAGLLVDEGLVRVSAEEALDRGLTGAFMPHGIGHHLGLQVHDVGGHQAAPEGGRLPPPDEHPFLRNTRMLEAGHVVTIEPGLYFIPMLLRPLRDGPESAMIDWDRVDALTPYGGIRVEDDVLCTEDGRDDLTRPLIAGHAG